METLVADGILYTVHPQPNGQKVRIATDGQSGEMLDAVVLPEKHLRSKAIKRRKVQR